jgi:hypothetical protein
VKAGRPPTGRDYNPRIGWRFFRKPADHGLAFCGTLDFGKVGIGLAPPLMDLLKESVSLVLVGIWNPAILNPEWLGKHLFEKEGGVPVTLEFSAVPGALPRLTMERTIIEPGRNRVVLRPEGDLSDQELDRVTGVAVKLLRLLPHTPMQGCGENFEFVEAAPGADHLNVFTAANDLPAKLQFEFTAKRHQIVSSIDFEGRTLNLTRTHADGQLRVAFNFHYNASSAGDAGTKLAAGPTFSENHRRALEILKSLYNTEQPEVRAEEMHA